MLTELRIANFAVIDRLALEFSSGFHVLTGETGAGKSILVDAIALLVGGRVSVDQIRADAAEAELEAAFTVPSGSPLVDLLRQAGALGPSDEELIVRRIISRSGRNRNYLNGHLTPLHVIQGLAGTLVDIHGQHDQQSLLSSTAQLEALDAFGDLHGLRSEYATRYRQWQARQRELHEVEQAAAQRAREEEFVRFRSQELEDASLHPGEEEALLAERNRLAHAQRLAELGEGAYQSLYEGESSVLSDLGRVKSRLRELGAIDSATSDWADLCDASIVQLRELAQQVREYLLHLEQDPERLSPVEERLDRIQRLKKKYGGSFNALLSQAEELKNQLSQLESSQSREADLRELVAQDRAELDTLATRLSQGRQQAAGELEKRVMEELATLRMQRTRFHIEVLPESTDMEFTPSGRDRVEYLLSANQGEPSLPLARVASGGELSRVMLAMKSVLTRTDRVPILIFDEVDAGIGGAVAEVVGRRLKKLSEYHQVFCITHLPQIASLADHHFEVKKAVKQGRTVTGVRRLDKKGRREEIARMLGGLTITRAVRETAAEMIGEADRSP